jgi:ABC-type branched-subunit amino acid transport system ATPase component
VVIIEHDMPLVMGISDSIVAMAAGRVVTSGKPDVVRAHPEVLRSYLGATA